MTDFNKPTNDTRNFLSVNQYIISEALHYSMESGKLQDSNQMFLDNSDKYYMLMIRVLNNKSRNLVYNYISYPSIFFDTFTFFLASRTKFIDRNYREPGHILSTIDNNLFTDSNLFGEAISDKLIISKKLVNFERIMENVSNSYYTITNTEIYRLINRLVIAIGINSMSKLVDLALKKEHEAFIKEILGSLDNYSRLVRDLKDDRNIEPISIINSCLFVVKDIEKFIIHIRDNNYNINQGPQPLRGQINSINNSLSILDMEYRKSLYNHNNHHVNSGNLASRLKLNKEKFSFNNVHMNLGGVRWVSTSTFSNTKNRDDLLQECYREIGDILKKKNSEKLDVLQREIEDLLFEGQSWFSSSKPNNKILYNSTTYDYIVNSRQTVNNLLSNPDKFSGNTKTHGTEYIPWFNKILKELGHKKVSDMLIQYFLYIVNNESVTIEDIETPGIPSLVCYNHFGKRVVNAYFYNKFMKSSKKTFSEFMDNDDEYKQTLTDNNFNVRVGGFFIYALIESKLVKLNLDSKSDEDYKYQEYIRLTRNSRKIMRMDKNQIVFHLPSKLPMICSPKEYVYSEDKKDVKLGGYLLNDIKYKEDIFIRKIGYAKPTILKDKNIIVDLVNGLSRTPYKVNTDTLNFIYKYGVQKDIVIDTDTEEIQNILDNPYNSTNKKTAKQHRSIVSKVKLERNVLNIAGLYSNVKEIYFPVRMDNRTRNYCITDYFDYQKNDLAKGLISFSKPGMWYKTDRDVIKYFKAFGANMFGGNLDKKSLNHRVDWVDENSERIVNFENNDIVNKAENKTCFVSFCFEYRRFIEYMNNNESNVFYSYLPIQLDATCNGYQHLSLLTREKNLFDVLNLASSTHDDDPDDFYTYILNLTIAFMKSEKNNLSTIKKKSVTQTSQLSSYTKLLKVLFDRSMVKKTIMTKSYNAGIPKQVSQLISNLDERSEGKTKYYTYKDNNDIKFKREDIVVFVMAIKSVIANESPRITALSKYLDGIVSICTKLNIPVPWNLPSGVEIMESYETENSKSFKAFFFVNTRYTFKSYQRGLYDLSKQKRATMPNLIHSLDATTIAILYNNFKNIGSLYTVHDCFGVTANNVPRLILKLKLVYIQLYSSKGYLRDFDNFVKTTINKTRGDDVYKINDDFVNIPQKKKNNNDLVETPPKFKRVPMPNINTVLDKSIDINCVKESANIIV